MLTTGIQQFRREAGLIRPWPCRIRPEGQLWSGGGQQAPQINWLLGSIGKMRQCPAVSTSLHTDQSTSGDQAAGYAWLRSAASQETQPANTIRPRRAGRRRSHPRHGYRQVVKRRTRNEVRTWPRAASGGAFSFGQRHQARCAIP